MNYNFIRYIAVIFLFCCDSKKQLSTDSVFLEKDSVAIYINQLKNNTDLKQKATHLLKAYDYNKTIKNDSIKNRNLLKITHQAFNINDSLLFRKFNNEAYLLSKKIKDTFGVADTHWSYGSFFNDYEIMDSAYYHYSKANEFFDDIDNIYYSGKMLYNMAIIEGQLKNYTGSEILIFNAISKFKPSERYLNLYRCYNHLGVIYKSLEEYDRAIFYYNEALKYLEKVAEKDKETFKESTLNNIGLVYQKNKEYDQASLYFKTALTNVALRFKNSNLHALLIDNLAYNRFLNGETTNLPDEFYKGLNIRDSLNNVSGQIINKLHLAEYFIKYNDTTKAIVYAKESNNLAKSISNNRDYLASLLFLSKIDKDTSKNYLKNYISLNDSLQIEERKVRNKFTRIRFETDEYVEETKRLSQQKIWISVVSLISILTLLSLFFLRRQRTKNRELIFETEQQKSNEEIYALMLKQQANLEEGRLEERHRISEELHDGVLGKLFGTRMGIGFLELKGESQIIEKHQSYMNELQQIEKEIRTISHELKNEILSSKLDFLTILKTLLETQSNIGSYSYTITSDDGIYWDEIEEKIKINFYRIIQEALLNINKYAQANHVNINFKITDKTLILTIQDNGVGFDINKNRKGIGLINMRSRSKKLGGTFSISSEVNLGTKIEVLIII